jgi:ArsR family transcriptional regulator
LLTLQYHIDKYRYACYYYFDISRTFDIIDTYKNVRGDFMKHSYADYVPAIKAMSDETRLKIIDMLSCGEMCACEILEEFSISQSTLSYHMKILSESGLVNAVRDGAWMRYTLNKERIDELKNFIACITSDKEDFCKTWKNKKPNNQCC